MALELEKQRPEYELQKNSSKLGTGRHVEPEYFSIGDIRTILKEKDIENIQVVSHAIYNNTAKFRCLECKKEFNIEPKPFLKNPECPYCNKPKELVK